MSMKSYFIQTKITILNNFQTSSIEREKISAELTELNKRYSMESQSRYFSCSDFFDGNLEFSRDDVIRSSLSSRNGKRNGPKEMILINVVLQRKLFPYYLHMIRLIYQDPDGEIENSGKSRIPKFCYIKFIVFDLSYLPVAAVGTQQALNHKKNLKNSFYIFTFFSWLHTC